MSDSKNLAFNQSWQLAGLESAQVALDQLWTLDAPTPTTVTRLALEVLTPAQMTERRKPQVHLIL